MAAFSEDFLSEDDFQAILGYFCHFLLLYVVNSFKVDEKIATDQKDYHKSFLGVIKNRPSVNNSKKCWLLGKKE